MIRVEDIKEAPWDTYQWDETVRSIDGTDTTLPKAEDVADVLYYGEDDPDWDGTVAVVVRLHDGRLVAWESDWGPTGSGFYADAYGGDAEVWFAPASELSTLVRLALSDHGRELCGIPREGFVSPDA